MIWPVVDGDFWARILFLCLQYRGPLVFAWGTLLPSLLVVQSLSACFYLSTPGRADLMDTSPSVLCLRSSSRLLGFVAWPSVVYFQDRPLGVPRNRTTWMRLV